MSVSQTMTASVQDNTRSTVSPVLQFALLITPIVMNGFFMVYSLTGWILEGRDKLNWAIEAESVAIWVGGGILVYSLLVMGYARVKRVARFHVLNVSSWGHMVVAALLTASVLISVRL